jgi:hypothetical protein
MSLPRGALKTAKSSQSMRLTFHGVQKFCFDYMGATLDDVRTCMVALKGVIHALSDGQNSLKELLLEVHNSVMLLLLIGAGYPTGYPHPPHAPRSRRGEHHVREGPVQHRTSTAAPPLPAVRGRYTTAAVARALAGKASLA